MAETKYKGVAGMMGLFKKQFVLKTLKHNPSSIIFIK